MTRPMETDVRDIMQGLEEFATFMSYQSNYEGLRIISVESADTTDVDAATSPAADVIELDSRRSDNQPLRHRSA